MRRKPQIKISNSKKPFNKKVLFGILISFCAAAQVFFTIGTSALGAQISSFEEEVELLTKENRELEDKLISSTSLIQLRQKAEDLGFAKSTTTYYIEKGEYYAMSAP